MSKKQRRVLFLISIVVFAFLSYVTTLYAFGYKYDFLNDHFVKTGVIHLKSQTDADVFINDRRVGRTNFWANSFSRSGLLSREYKVRVEKEGYHPWQKTVSVSEGVVSDFSNIFLVKKDLVASPENKKNSSQALDAGSADQKKLASISSFFSTSAKNIKKSQKHDGYIYILLGFGREKLLYKIKDDFSKKDLESELLGSGVEGFLFSGNKEKIAWFSKTEVWVQWLKDSSYQPYKLQGEKELLMRTSKVVRSIELYPTDEHIFVLLGNEIEFVELDGRSERNRYKIFEDFLIKDMIYDRSGKKVVIELKDKFVSIDI